LRCFLTGQTLPWLLSFVHRNLRTRRRMSE
jgi:hypothetical protein